MKEFSGLHIGILAIQGDYEMHQQQVERLSATPHLVKLPRDLEKIDALIMPGGESTTMSVMMDRFHLRQPLTEFGLEKPIYGTCAGMIMVFLHIERPVYCYCYRCAIAIESHGRDWLSACI